MTLQQLNRRLISKALEHTRTDLPGLVYSTKVTPHGIVLRTSPRKLRALSFYVRNNGRFLMRTLVDIAVVDRIRGPGRFVVNYLFLSMILNQRIILQLSVDETVTIPTLTAPFANNQRLFACAAWLEREV
jgi:NADH:ubiquinone oxidoreductase subunit C